MTYFYIEERFDGAPVLIDKPYTSEREAEQSAMQFAKGFYRIVSFPSRDKVKVRNWWKQSLYNQ